MNVGELKELLSGIADEVEVVTPGSDHSYRVISCAGDETAGRKGNNYWEWFSSEDNAGELPVRVVVIE